MTLINNIADIQNYIAVSSNIDFDLIKPYLAKAERKYIVPTVSKTQLENLKTLTTPTDTQTEVLDLFKEATCNLAFHLGFTIFATKISNYGIVDPELKDAKKTEWWQQRDLRRTLINDGHQALDEALKVMEENTTIFSDWKKSNSYTIYTDFFCRKTDDFNTYFNIHGSRLTFRALHPYIREVHEQYFFAMLGIKTFNQILAKADDDVLMRAYELCQKAEVALTIASVAVTGTFHFTETGFFLRYEVLPWEKVHKDLDDKRLQRLAKQKHNAGEEYLKKLKALIEGNSDVFPAYKIAKQTGNDRILKRKSGLGI